MADTPLRANADPQWRAVHLAALTGEPEARSAFLDAVRALILAVSVQRILQALALRDPTNAVAALNLEALEPAIAAGMVGALERIATAAAESALGVVEREALTGPHASLLLRLGQGMPKPEIVDWARQYGLALARDLSAETRYALQNIIARALNAGQAPAVTARLIEQVIGLTQRQTAALLRYRETLLNEGIALPRVERMVARYSARLLRARATAISRTESITAANAGNRLVWERNVREGTVDPSRWVREWIAIVPSDGRTCPDCEDMDGQTAPIGQPYISPAYGEVWGPALHPQCRCSEVLVRA